MGVGETLELSRTSMSTANSTIQNHISPILFHEFHPSFNNLAPLNSNVDAIDATRNFANGYHSLVGIVGPSGWGKTHLLGAAAASKMAAVDETVKVIPALDFALGIKKVEVGAPLILDNLQDAIGRGRSSQNLRALLERRVKAQHPTLVALSSTRGIKAVKGALPLPREWVLAAIDSPSVTERLLVIENMGKSEGIELGPSLTFILANYLKGNGLTILGCLKRLRVQSARWISDSETLRACGVLNPYFTDSAEWDLRETIDRVVAQERSIPGMGVALATYVMLRVARLSEADIASYYSIEPVKVYMLANSIEKLATDDPALPVLSQKIAKLTVESLCKKY